MITMNFTPFPTLETDRLILRNLCPADMHDVFAIRSHPETMRYIPRPIAQSLDDAKNLIDIITGFTASNERINWALTEKGSDRLIGIIGYVGFKPESFRAEVGYVLHHAYRQKGLAFEALQAVLDYGFNVLKLHSIEAIINPDNVASISLAEKAGFIREGHMKDYVYHDGRFWDELLYSLIRTT